MEFAMLPTCQPCIDAGKKIEIMKQSVGSAHPGKVEYFVFDFSGGHDCSVMYDWENSNGMHSTLIQHGETEVDYYGGMGMPTFVLVAGAEHTILWLNIGFTPSDTTVIKDKINAFYAATGTNSALNSVNLSFSPNPVQTNLNITANDQGADIQQVHVFDLLGNEVLSQKWMNGAVNKLEVKNLVKGSYYLQLLNGENKLIGAKRFIKA
jgi:hypothetical protein